MIAFPPNHALARTASCDAPPRNLKALAATLLALVATALVAASPAHATGGVSVSDASTATPAKAKKKKAKAKGAQADGADAGSVKSVNKAQLRRAQTLLRLSATGTHDAKTRSTVKRFQRLRGLTANGIVDTPTYVQIKNAFALLETGGAQVETDDTGAGGATTADTGVPAPVFPANLAPITPQERAILDKIAACESKGDPTIVSSNGLYRGKYQFDKSTWKAVGGAGDPAEATPEEQDQRAAILLRQRGTAPWPVCGA